MKSLREWWFDRLIDKSSLGTPHAKALRGLTPPDVLRQFERDLTYRASRRTMRDLGYDPTYTREQFDEARDGFIAEFGYDPCDRRRDTGWQRWCYYGQRFQYWAPWKTTEPWNDRWDTGSDEHCNPSIIMVLPKLLGTIVIFPSVQLRTWFDGPCVECTELMSEECDLCPLCMIYHKPLCLKINP